MLSSTIYNDNNLEALIFLVFLFPLPLKVRQHTQISSSLCYHWQSFLPKKKKKKRILSYICIDSAIWKVIIYFKYQKLTGRCHIFHLQILCKMQDTHSNKLLVIAEWLHFVNFHLKLDILEITQWFAITSLPILHMMKILPWFCEL